MTPRRLLAAILAAVVLATGVAAAVHAHSPHTGAGTHDSESCAVCRLAHESAPAALAPVCFVVVATTSLYLEAPLVVAAEPDLDPARSPRAPPRPSLG